MREQKIGLVYRKNERKEIMKDWDYAKGMEIGQGNPGLGVQKSMGKYFCKIILLWYTSKQYDPFYKKQNLMHEYCVCFCFCFLSGSNLSNFEPSFFFQLNLPKITAIGICMHRKTQMSHLSHSGSVHGQNDSYICKK